MEVGLPSVVAWELILLAVEKVLSIVSWPVEAVVGNLTVIVTVEVLIVFMDKVGDFEG